MASSKGGNHRAFSGRIRWKRLTLVALGLTVCFFGYRIAIASGRFYALLPIPGTLRGLLDQRGHFERNAAFLDLMGIDPESSLAPELIMGSRFESIAYKTTLSDATLLRFFNSGILETYGLLPGFHTEVAQSPKPLGEPPIEREALIPLMKKLVATGAFDRSPYEGLVYEYDNATVEYIPEHSDDLEEGSHTIVEDGTWRVILRRSYRGIRCHGELTLKIDVKTGCVEYIRNRPFYPPKSLKESITETEAAEIASNIAAKRRVPTERHEATKALIVQPSFSWFVLGYEPRSTLCWVVTYQRQVGPNYEHPFTIMIECWTGNVYGVDDF